MPRSMKDSDDDAEPKTGRVRSQKLNINSAVNSPLRRSSRIKQGRSSPVSSESDTSSISSNQPIKNTRSRRATMDNVSDKLKGGHPRKPSISPDIESIEVDILGTPKKRATRSSLAAVTSIDTPTKINTRAASKRLMRAGSETKSPLPTVRTTRRTRATSVEPESLFEQNRSQPGTPVKIHKRASVLLSDSPVKKEDEKKNRIPYVRLDATIVETDEFTNSGNSDSSPDKALHSQQSQRINKRHQSIHQDEVEEDNSHDKITSSLTIPISSRTVSSVSKVSSVSSVHSKSDESLQLSEKGDELHDKHTDKVTVDNEINLVEECKSEENLLSNNDTTDEVSTKDNFSRNLSSSKKEDKLEIINKSPSGVKKSLGIDKYSKELMIKIENLTNISVKEQKGNPSNKENQILNENQIINDTLIENIQPITNVTLSSPKCLTPIFANKSSSEKETKFTKNESSLTKRRHSRESIETTMKHGILSKEVIDDIEEKMDISTDSSSPDLTYKQKYLDSPSVNDTTKRQSLIHEDSKSTRNDTNESVLSQPEDVEIIDEAIVKDKTPIKQISKSTEMEEVTKSDKVDKIERAIMDTDSDISKESNEIELNKILCLPKNQSETESDNKKSSSPISIIDDNEMRLVLEEQSLYRDKNESSNKLPHFNSDHSVDLPTSVNKNSNNQSTSIMENQSVITQDNITDSTDFTEQEQRNFSKHATESVLESSNTALEILDSTSNELNKDNSIIQNTQLSNVTEASGYVTSISSKREERKRMWLKNSVKQNLKRKSTDNIHDHLEKEKENLQLENQRDTNTNTDPDVSVNISLFQDISSDNSNKKIIEKEIDVETISVHSNSQLLKESENESECDLVLVDKKAWLAAENIKAAKEAESFEYDSDDTVLLKSRQDAMTTNYDAKQLPTINEELLESREKVDATVRSHDKKSLTMMEEEKEDDDIEAFNSFTRQQKYKATKMLSNSSLSSTEDKDDLITAVNKSINEFKIILNQSNDRSISKLNKSGQTVAKATERSFETHDESDEQIEDDANGLNRNSQVSKKDTSLSKSMERRKSLNKSSTKDTPSRKGDKVIQNISISKSREDYSMKEPDDTDVDLEKKLQKKKHSLNKSQKDENTSEFEEKSLSKLVNAKTPTHLNDDESDNSEIVIRAVNFECESYSTGSDPDKVLDSSDTDVSTSVHSDVKREYNLDGAEQKFSDDNVPGDECRASESEVSDPDDDGSDLADFIVNDDEVEKEEDDDDDEEKEESNSEEENDENIEEAGDTEEEEVDDESENEQNVKEDKVAEKKEIKDKNYEQAHIDVQNVEDENEEDDILDKEEDEEKSKHISPRFNTRMSSSPEIKSTKIKRDSKVKKSDVKNKTILLDTSDSDSSIKNKSYTKKNEDTILLDTSFNLSVKKKRKSEVQFSPKDVTKQNSIEHLNTSEIRKLSKSLLKCSTPKFDIRKQKFEFNETSETLEKISEIKDIKSGSTKTTQNISLEKKKSNKDSILKEHCLEFKNTRERLLNISLPSNLTEAIEKAGLSKPSSKMAKLHKTMNVTHTESPTIRYLRKEKLNESAPALRVNMEIDSLEKKLLPIKKTKDIVQTETKLESNEEEISNLVTPPNDDAIQKSNRKKQKKRKTPAEDISSENITDKASFQEMQESDAPKKKKRVKLVQLPIVEDDTCKDTCQIIEKKKKRKKKQLKINEQNENINEANVLQKNIRKNKTELAQHKRTNFETVDSAELDLSADNYVAVEKKTKRQKIAESKEIVSEKLLKKKKKREEKTSPTLQTGISKLKSNKNLKSNKLQNIASDTIKSKNDAFAKARDEALEAIRAAEMRIRAKKELKKKKRENVENMIREQVLKIPEKQRKKVVEKNDFLPSTGRLKRLPDDVVENLTDLPTKAKKRQKLSQHQEQIVSLSGHSSKSKASTTKDDGFVALSSSGSTTEFAVVDLQKTKKQQQTSFAAASFRQRMLARNNRAPVSAYMMYLEKQKATSNNRFFNNAF